MTRMIKIITAVTTMLFVLGTFSCSNMHNNCAGLALFGTAAPDVNVPYLTLRLDDAAVSKTLLPSIQNAVFTNIVLKGARQGESTKTLGSWTSIAAMQTASIPIEVGVWTFTLSATSGGNSFGGTLEKEIVGGHNHLLFSLVLIDMVSGKGSFWLSLSFDRAVNAQNVSRVVASLENMDKTIVSGYESKNLAVSNNAVTFSGSQIATGTYRARIKFYAIVNGVDTEIASWSELVQIASGFDSTASRTLESFDELYTISYELNGGFFATGTVVPETFARRSNVMLPSLENVLRNDSAYGGTYKAVGWYTDENCASGNEITNIENIARNITVYAKWPSVYTITYNLNGGAFASGYVPHEKFIQDDIVDLPEAERVSRNYYIFDGWYADENCTEENKITAIANKLSDITVYAKWTPVVYKITSYIGLYPSETTYTVEDDVTLNDPQDEDVSFVAWYEDETCSGTPVVGWSAGERHDDITFYADYTMPVTVNVDENSIARVIGKMKANGTIKATGEFNAEVISQVRSTLQKLNESRPDVFVKLDLSSVTGLESIEYPGFLGCASLRSVSLPTVLKSICAEGFQGCESLTSISIPNGVTTIGNDAFYYCKCLDDIVIPDTVETIGERAFLNCYGLRKIKLPSGLTSINAGLFSGCSQLGNVILPEGIEKIGREAFYGCCYDLESITLPSGLKSIGTNAFKNCYKLTDVVFADTTKPWYYKYDNVSYPNNLVGGAIGSLSNSSENAKKLTDTYVNCYWLTTDKEVVY